MLIRPALLLALTILPLSAHAQTNARIGSLMAVEGSVSVKRDGKDKNETAAVAMPVYAKDLVETGARSRVLILLDDETEVTLGADSALTLDEYIFVPGAETGNKAAVSVLRGAFLYASGLIGKVARPDVVITIPYGTIGLRGTTVWGGTLDDQYGVFVADGKVSLQTKRGSAILSKGDGIDLLGANKAPNGRKVWAEEKVAMAIATVALKDQDAVTARVTKEKESLRAARGDTPPAEEPKTEEEKKPENPATPEPPALIPQNDAPAQDTQPTKGFDDPPPGKTPRAP